MTLPGDRFYRVRVVLDKNLEEGDKCSACGGELKLGWSLQDFELECSRFPLWHYRSANEDEARIVVKRYHWHFANHSHPRLEGHGS
jgi:hypothetical protein